MRFPSPIMPVTLIALLASIVPAVADTVAVEPLDVAAVPEDMRQSLFEEVVTISASLAACDTTPSDLTVEEAEILWISGLTLAETLRPAEGDYYNTQYRAAEAMLERDPEQCAQFSGNIRPMVMTLVGYGTVPVLSE